MARVGSSENIRAVQPPLVAKTSSSCNDTQTHWVTLIDVLTKRLGGDGGRTLWRVSEGKVVDSVDLPACPRDIYSAVIHIHGPLIQRYRVAEVGHGADYGTVSVEAIKEGGAGINDHQQVADCRNRGGQHRDCGSQQLVGGR